MLFLETGMLGTFVALNLFQFYVFWELMLIPMYFIIGVWGGPRRIYAAVKFFLFTMFGSLLMLVAILVVYYLQLRADRRPELRPGGRAGERRGRPARRGDSRHRETVWWKTQPWLFAAFALAFAIKVPMVPFHTWLPDAHVEAPTAGSVVLAGVLLKMGTYGFLRFALPLFPVGSVEFAPWIHLHPGGRRDHLRLAGRHGPVRHQEARRLLVGGAPGLRDAGDLRAQRGGPGRRRAPDGQPRALDRGALPPGGHALRARHTREIADFGGIAKPMPVYAASSASSPCRASACRC